MCLKNESEDIKERIFGEVSIIRMPKIILMFRPLAKDCGEKKREPFVVRVSI